MKQYIRIKRGSEGPHHDPYSFVEVTVHRLDGTVVTGHCGIGRSLKVNKRNIPLESISGDLDDPQKESFERLFLAYAGIKWNKAFEYEYRIRRGSMSDREYEEQEERWAYYDRLMGDASP